MLPGDEEDVVQLASLQRAASQPAFRLRHGLGQHIGRNAVLAGGLECGEEVIPGERAPVLDAAYCPGDRPRAAFRRRCRRAAVLSPNPPARTTWDTGRPGQR